jgi:hypothetical protein
MDRAGGAAMTTFGLVDRTYARGKADGAAAERNAIVVWLRTYSGVQAALLMAAAIERGEHCNNEPVQWEDGEPSENEPR